MTPSTARWCVELLERIRSKCAHRVRNIEAIRQLIQQHSIAVMVLMATIKCGAMWNISMRDRKFLRAEAFTQQIDRRDRMEKVSFILLNDKLSYEIYTVMSARAVMGCIFMSSSDFNGSE